MSEAVENEIIGGTVEDIKFRNEQNGYTVLEIGCDEELVTAVGTFADISVGETVRLSGFWTFHPTFGRQFKVEAFFQGSNLTFCCPSVFCFEGEFRSCHTSLL